MAWDFEFYSSLPFWTALAGAVLAVRLASRSARHRGVVLLAVSSAALLAIPRFGVRELVLVAAVALASLAAVQALLRPELVDAVRRRWIAGLAIASVLGVLGGFKYGFVQDLVRRRLGEPVGPADYVFLVGVSYFSFKAIHVVIEAYKRALPEVRPLAYLNYISFFPSFVSGPINRYPQWAAQFSAAPRPGSLGRDLRSGGERLVHGLFKKFVLVPIVFPYVLTAQGRPLGELSIPQIAIGLYAYALYFFFDFSGYTDLALGTGRLMGFELPENFARPFFQKNIRDLWSSWHISLTTWLVDYVYWPVVRRLRNAQYFRTRPVLLSVVGMNATFLACGAWHGEAANFLLWGAYHGLGISVLNVYQREKKKLRYPLAQRWFRSRASRIAGAVATFHFFAAGLALFVLDLDRLRALAEAVLRWRWS